MKVDIPAGSTVDRVLGLLVDEERGLSGRTPAALASELSEECTASSVRKALRSLVGMGFASTTKPIPLGNGGKAWSVGYVLTPRGKTVGPKVVELNGQVKILAAERVGLLRRGGPGVDLA